MAPGEVRADQHDEIGLLEILVAAGHRVGAERALVAGDRRGHAQPRVGVDVGRADEALHQLVGDVVVLGQQLAGDVEGDAVGAVLRRSCR